MTNKEVSDAVAAERERCAQIAQRVSDRYVGVLTDYGPIDFGLQQYADGASDAAEEILAEIEGRNDSTQ